MAIDITKERPISLKQAAAMRPSSKLGRPVHTSTLLKDIKFGRTVNGVLVKLEGLLLDGTHWVTSQEALQRFAERCTAAALGENSPPSCHTSASRERAVARADAELARLGI